MLAEFKCVKCNHQWKTKAYPTLCISCGHPFVKWLNYIEMFELIFKKSIEAYDIFSKLMREDSIECEPID